MSTMLETRPPRTTAPTVPPTTREPELPSGPARIRRWLAWMTLAAALVLVGIAVLLGNTTETDTADTYAPHGMQAGYADGWFRPDVPVATSTGAPVAHGTATVVTDGWLAGIETEDTATSVTDGWFAGIEAQGTTDIPLQQGYRSGLPDGWFEPEVPAAASTGVAATSYPARLVR